MMTSPSHDKHNEQPHVRFKGPDDVTIRSAWSSTNQSLAPPSLVHRQPTLSTDEIAEALKNCEDVMKDDAVAKIMGKPPALKHRLHRSTPILKVRSNDDVDGKGQNKKQNSQTKPRETDVDIDSQLFRSTRDKPGLDGFRKTRSAWDITETRNSVRRETDVDIDSQLFRLTRDKPGFDGFRKTRSAWDITETRNSVTSVFGIGPVQRQKTLEEADLKDAAKIAALLDAKAKAKANTETNIDQTNRSSTNENARW